MDGLVDRRKRNGWFWDYNSIFDLGLSVYALAVRLYLARCANAEAVAFPSASTIARALGISRRKVFDALDELERAGLIAKHTRKREGTNAYSSNMYVLLEPPTEGSAQDALVHDMHHQQESEGSAQDALVHDMHQGGAQDALGVVHEVHSKDYIDEGLTKEGQTDKSGVSDQISQVVAAWHQHIGQIGPVAFEKLRYWVEEMDMPAEVVAEAIATAADAGKRRINYVEGILRNWHNDGVHTLEKARERRKPRQKEEASDPGGINGSHRIVAQDTVDQWVSLYPELYADDKEELHAHG